MRRSTKWKRSGTKQRNGRKPASDFTKTAFEALLAGFCGWDALRDADGIDIEYTIRKVTFPETKAHYLKAALMQMTRLNGVLTLDNLNDMPATEALAWLEPLPGVGRKIAAATLNFSPLRKAVLVIDTHHLRILRRLRLVRAGADFFALRDASLWLALRMKKIAVSKDGDAEFRSEF